MIGSTGVPHGDALANSKSANPSPLTSIQIGTELLVNADVVMPRFVVTEQFTNSDVLGIAVQPEMPEIPLGADTKTWSGPELFLMKMSGMPSPLMSRTRSNTIPDVWRFSSTVPESKLYADKPLSDRGEDGPSGRGGNCLKYVVGHVQK